MNSSVDGGDWFPLTELTERLAQLVWVEERLGDLLDGWASNDAHDGSAITFASAAGHHRWHGEVLRGCLPTSDQLADLAMPRAPTPGWADAVEVLGGLDAQDDTVVRLMVMVREVQPWLARETASLLDLGRPVADAALIRWLGFIEIDHRTDGGRLAELLNGLQTNTISMRDRSVVAGLDLANGPSVLDQ